MKTHTVEILIIVIQDEDSRLFDGEPNFTGEYVLRALDIRGDVLREVRAAMTDLGVWGVLNASTPVSWIELSQCGLMGRLGRTGESGMRAPCHSWHHSVWAGQR